VISVVAKSEALPGKARSALFGYAVLRANFNHKAPSYVDNFKAFVLDALAVYGPGDEAAVGQAIRDTFGFTIPDMVVGRLLGKLSKTGQIEIHDDGIYQIEDSALEGLANLRESMRQFLLQQSNLREKFTGFVRESHYERFGLIETDPDSHLQAFIEQHAAALLRRGVSDQQDVTPWGELHGAEFLVGSFVLHVEASDAATFGYLIDAVKGAILAGVLEMDTGDLRQSLKGLTLVFDTPVLLSALGYQGAIPQRAAEQMLKLANTQGVKLEYFDHTEKELHRVLDAAITTLRRPARSAESWSAAAHHFEEIGFTPADIVAEQSMLGSNLQRLGLGRRIRPDDYYKYGLDESALEDLLKTELPAQKETTRLYDLQSISAMHRLRKGGSPAMFERCGYIFVTDNSGLVTVARKMSERHLWPLVMLESEVASLLWVRSPAIVEDLPRHRLLAAAYAGMQPAPHLWMRYAEEIERLEKRGQVKSDEAVILRSRPEARDVLMDVTLGEPGNINAESMDLIVSRVREHISSPFRREADSANAARDGAAQEAMAERKVSNELRERIIVLQAKLERLETDVEVRDDRIRHWATRRAHRVMLAAVLITIAILVVPEALKTIDPDAVTHLPVWLSLAFSAVAAIMAGLGVVSRFMGGTVLDWLKPIERRLAARAERRWRVSAGLLPLQRGEQAPAPSPPMQ
jgi:hypothetical protein